MCGVHQGVLLCCGGGFNLGSSKKIEQRIHVISSGCSLRSVGVVGLGVCICMAWLKVSRGRRLAAHFKPSKYSRMLWDLGPVSAAFEMVSTPPSFALLKSKTVQIIPLHYG